MAAKAKAKAKKSGGDKPAKPAGGAKSGKSKGGFKGSWKLMLLAILGLALATDVAFSLLPSNYVPESLKPIHDKVLFARNEVLAKTVPQAVRYEDSAEIPVEGAAPIKVHFAPSPSIAPALDAFLSKARTSLCVCAYDIRLPDVADALIAASKRGVKVRVVTDADNFHVPEVDRLLKAGIPVRPDNKESIMHNKFVVADGRLVWTGSYNFTPNCSRKNDNNALEIDSPSLANCYAAKFEEYWAGLFSQSAPRTSAGYVASTGNVQLAALFSPSDGVQARLLNELSEAQVRVDVMAFAFTSKPLAEKLCSLAARGVQVRCLFDHGMAENPYSKDELLQKAGVKTRLSSNRSGKMHHKVVIIDSSTVITGSYNYTNNAEFHNDENILIVRSPAAVAVFEDEFQRCWDGVKGY